MILKMLKSKLHQACVTDANVNYEGSFGIDSELMDAVGLYPYEKVLIANVNNGSRLETYAIPEPFGSKRMVLNGAAAKWGAAGDRVIIMSFCDVEEAIVRQGLHRPRVIRLNECNEPVSSLNSVSTSMGYAAMLGG